MLNFTFKVAFISLKFYWIASELIWTPILPSQPDQVDLWTLSQSGCSCKDGSRGRGGEDCACCVPRSACPCGDKNPHRCAQCGLQHHCNNMCNMTIDGALLSVSAGTLEGSLVSPSNPGPPIYCWYSLRAPPGHRIEVQLHRLVHIGTSLNGTACRGGYVEVSDADRRNVENERDETEGWSNDRLERWKDGRSGWSSRRGMTTFRICGEDQRLHPPIVLFSDSGIATILYRVRDKKGSPRFIAYYNFPPVTHPSTGDKQWGGSRIEYTDCDWLYQDSHCHPGSQCHLTSPGHPGVYPSNTKCKYLFTMASPTIKGTLTFISVDLPPERCSTNYISVHAGTSTTSPILATLCGTTKRTIQFDGPNALLIFSSGPFQNPFQFNGFHASLHFAEKGEGVSPRQDKTQTPPAPPLKKASDTGLLSDPSGTQVGDAKDCLRVFWSNSSRSGHFDTSSYAHSHLSSSASTFTSYSSNSLTSTTSRREKLLSTTKHCRLRFVGKSDEVVQISFFKYRLGGESCSSEVSIYDGVAEEGSKNLIHHICGPITREPKDSSGKFIQPEFLISSSNLLEVQMTFGKGTDPERQFLAGAFQFHSSRLEGTKKPNSVCDVMFYGASSPREGIVRQPSSALLWNLEGQLTCSYLFVPGANQSLQLTIESIAGNRGSGHCKTICSSSGCKCRSNSNPLRTIDHIYFIDSRKDTIITCLCGDVRNITPITLLSTYGIDVRYHVGRYIWSSPGFNFTLKYHFPAPKLCGTSNYNTPAGMLVPPSDSSIEPLIFIYSTCLWVIENQMDTHLTIIVQPPSTGNCDIWNMSVVARLRVGEDQLLGNVCGGGVKGSFFLGPAHSAALITLNRGGRTGRNWLVNWLTRRSGIPISELDQYTPKPELSRTLHGHPTGRTFIVRSYSTTFNICPGLIILQQYAVLIAYSCNLWKFGYFWRFGNLLSLSQFEPFEYFWYLKYFCLNLIFILLSKICNMFAFLKS